MTVRPLVRASGPSADRLGYQQVPVKCAGSSDSDLSLPASGNGRAARDDR